jgi:hypothetical protein
MHRPWLFLAALAAPAAVHAQAEAQRGIEDPRALVAEMYARYDAVNDAPIPEPRHAYSPRLRALFEAYDAWARAHEDLVGSLDFDWWANAQDWDISNVSIVEYSFGADRKVIEAHWRNYDRADSSRFFFIRENGRWFLDDVVNGSGGGGDGWTLSALLSARPE